jgi:transposase
MLSRHRRLYDLALRERRDVFESEKRSVTYGEQSGRFKAMRKSLPGFAALNFSSAQATLRRLDRAFKAFFRRVKSDDAPGYPRFKPEDRFRTVEFPSHGDGCKLKENGRLYLQNIGHIKVKLHRPVEGAIKTVSVKRACGKWYVIFSYKAEEAGTRVVAVDPRTTTQVCSACGAMPLAKKTLSDRAHSCSCGYLADRDVNAARNILGLGLSLRDETYRVAESVSREAVCFS